jgi:hypothetical protein
VHFVTKQPSISRARHPDASDIPTLRFGASISIRRTHGANAGPLQGSRPGLHRLQAPDQGRWVQSVTVRGLYLHPPPGVLFD